MRMHSLHDHQLVKRDAAIGVPKRLCMFEGVSIKSFPKMASFQNYQLVCDYKHRLVLVDGN